MNILPTLHSPILVSAVIASSLSPYFIVPEPVQIRLPLPSAAQSSVEQLVL
jgi:hypothetical protein